MRITLTHPYTWPYVQRGGERLFDDLARWLSGAGHEITTVSAVPGRGGRHQRDDRLAVEHRAIAPRVLRRVDVDQAVTYLPGIAASDRRARPDVLHGLSYLDGVAARLARQRPFVLHLQGMPVRRSLAHRPVHRRLVPMSLKAADAVITVSRAAADAARAEFGVDARPIHNGLFTAEFAAAREHHGRADRPTILFPGAVNDERKRLSVLVDAIAQLQSQWPELLLDIAATTAADQQAKLRARLGDRVRFLGVHGPAEMGAAYANAWVTCLPAVREAFGLVFVESLATGTPVVGVRDGGVPEVVTEPDWLAHPDDAESLATALGHALRAAQDAGIVERCQTLAAPFDWSVRGPDFVALYHELLSSTPSSARD
jgi:glycosyltransferase involved in cell wall biosynthesis